MIGSKPAMGHSCIKSIFQILRVLCTIAVFCAAFAVQAESNKLRVAFPSAVDIDDVALLLAFEAMEASGTTVTPTFFAQGELAAVALAGGQVDVGTGSSTVWLTAIQKLSLIHI